MTSRAEAIIQAMVSKLTVPAMSSVPASAVFRDLNVALSSDYPVAVIIEEGDEPAPNTRILGKTDRSLTVSVIVIARGENAATLADAPMLEAYNRVVNDPQLGGLAFDLSEGGVKRERDALETNAVAVTRVYQIAYRTDTYSLE